MTRKKSKLRSTARKKVTPVNKLAGVERVLALDPSSRCCGWSIFDNGTLVGFGRFVQEGEGHGERLMNFRSWLLDLLERLQPDVVVYEAPYSGRMRNTFGILSRYAGQIEAAHFEAKRDELSKENAFPSRMVKKLMAVKKGKTHTANKKNMLLLINKLYGLNLKFKDNDTTKKVSQDDEADAIALNHAWHLRYRKGAVTPTEAEVPDVD